MSPGPLRRLTGAIGLLALAPTAVMLTTDAITVADAALRAGVTLVGVILLGRVTGWWLSSMARGLERDAAPDPGVPRRRASDRTGTGTAQAAGTKPVPAAGGER